MGLGWPRVSLYVKVVALIFKVWNPRETFGWLARMQEVCINRESTWLLTQDLSAKQLYIDIWSNVATVVFHWALDSVAVLIVNCWYQWENLAPLIGIIRGGNKHFRKEMGADWIMNYKYLTRSRYFVFRVRKC